MRYRFAKLLLPVLATGAWCGFDPAELFDLSRLHEPRTDRVLYEVSSFDREGRNIRDGFVDAFYLYREDDEYVVFDETGPGVLVNLWTPRDTTGDHTGDISFFFDGDTTPRISVSAQALFSGGLPLFPYPLSADHSLASGGNFSFSPLAFRERLKIRFSKKPWFYHFHFYRLKEAGGLVSADASLDYRSLAGLLGPDTISMPLARLAYQETVAPGATVKALSVSGNGVIRDICVQLPPAGIEVTRNLVLIGIFDGAAVPQILSPLPDLFGCRNGVTPFVSAPARVDSGGMHLFFPMPFKDSACFYLRNENRAAAVPVSLAMAYSSGDAPDSCTSFFARRFHELNVYNGRDFTLCAAGGEGHFAGSFLSMEGDRGRGHLEGDERFYADGRSCPDLHGTGLEDYFLSGWYFINGCFSLPFAGYTSSVKGARERMCLYRFHVSDRVPFLSSFKAGLERFPWNFSYTEYASTAFYYNRPAPRLVKTDSLWMGNDSLEKINGLTHGRLMELRDLSSTYAGDSAAVLGGRFCYFLDSLCFRMKIRRDNRGAILRIMTDCARGGQAADVFADSVFLGRWRISYENPYSRLYDADFDLPESVTAGRESLSIRIMIPPLEGAGERGIGMNLAKWEAYSIAHDTAAAVPGGILSDPAVIQDWGNGTAHMFEWGPEVACPPNRILVYRDTVEKFKPGLSSLAGAANGQLFTDERLSIGKRYHYRFALIDANERLLASSAGAVAVGTAWLDREGEELFPLLDKASCPVIVHLTFNEDGSRPDLPDTAEGRDRLLSNGRYLKILCKKPGDSASFNYFVNDRDTFCLQTGSVLGPMFGRFEVLVNGKPAGLSADGVSESTGVVWTWADSVFVMEPGYNTITFRSTGKHPRSLGYRIGLDRYRLMTLRQRYEGVPDSLKLRILSCYPNPFNPAVRIHFELAEDMDLIVGVYDVNGRLIRLLSDRRFPRNDYSIVWDGRTRLNTPAPSGLYFIRFKAKLHVRTARVILVR